MKFHFSKKAKGLVLTLFTACFLVFPSNGREERTESEAKTEKKPKTQRVSVVAERFNFTPSRIKVKEGTLLEIILTSDDTFHGFRVPSANINQIIPARGRGNVKVIFDAKEKGSYPFECSRPCGAGHTMMRGVIIVE
jgi:cytochrome c oxidase subunit II